MSFTVTTNIAKCRKPRRCYWCNECINIGEPAVRIVGGCNGGDFGWSHYHPECFAALEAMPHEEREGYGLNDPDDPCEPGAFKRRTKECVI